MSGSLLLLILPVLTALVVILVPARDGHSRGPLAVALAGASLTLLTSLVLTFNFEPNGGVQFVTLKQWIPEIGVTFHLGIDGISLVMLLLTTLLSLVGLMAVPGTMNRSSRAFLVWFLLLESTIIGVFIARDWFLFYLFWEIALVPMFFLIGIWGGEKRAQASFSFFLYTLAGSMLMLIGLMASYVQAGGTGFEMDDLAVAMRAAPSHVQTFVFLCVFIGMAVKVPVVPLHGWLPTAHVEAPVPVSIMLSGVLLKMGGYGLLRLVEMTPGPYAEFGNVIMVAAIFSIVYGAILAFRQDDLKAMIAYSSISHMGFVVLGIASLNEWGLQGSVIQMFSHGLVTASLFFLVGLVYAQTHSRSLVRASGIARANPRFAVLMTMSLLAAMGLPGLSGFVGEFQVFVGAYQRWGFVVALAGLGVLITTAYSLRVFGRMIISAQSSSQQRMRELGTMEMAALVPLAALMVAIGVFPDVVGRYAWTGITALAVGRQ